MMEELHDTHQGVESTLRRAKGITYWPNLKAELSDYISKCDTCCAIGARQSKETLISHDIPDHPWAKIATDLFEHEKKNYLVTVDYFSNFFEIDRLYSTGTVPESFERGGPEAIIWKILERGAPKSLKMAFECPFQLFSYKSFANIPPKGGGALGPSPKSATAAPAPQQSSRKSRDISHDMESLM